MGRTPLPSPTTMIGSRASRAFSSRKSNSENPRDSRTYHLQSNTRKTSKHLSKFYSKIKSLRLGKLTESSGPWSLEIGEEDFNPNMKGLCYQK
mmetsp:Transcript_15335/g.18604  ORF Transcript_15335/g.18604 Transcript_15335/m.18604 type:complete len:93 (-) Transcript_15335:1401-1679(-)